MPQKNQVSRAALGNYIIIIIHELSREGVKEGQLRKRVHTTRIKTQLKIVYSVDVALGLLWTELEFLKRACMIERRGLFVTLTPSGRTLFGELSQPPIPPQNDGQQIMLPRQTAHGERTSLVRRSSL